MNKQLEECIEYLQVRGFDERHFSYYDGEEYDELEFFAPGYIKEELKFLIDKCEWFFFKIPGTGIILEWEK